MSVGSQAGYVSFAVQSAKYGDTTYDPTTVAWLNHKALSADVSPQQFIDALPPEVGGGLFSSGNYKMGAYVSGGYALNARLENSLGHLLYGASGQAVTGTARTAGTYSGSTIFRVNPSDDTAMPWLTLRRFIPPTSGTDGQTEYFVDCRVAAMAITVPAMGVMRTEFTFQGRKPVWQDGKPTSGTGAGQVGAAFESNASIGMSCVGKVELPGLASALPSGGGKFTSAQIIIANQMTRPQDEMIIGSYYPDDFTPLGRSAVVRLIYKWADAGLYRKLYMANASGGYRAWTPVTVSSDVRITSQSADVVSTYANNYALQFYAPSADWIMSPVTLAPQQLLQVEVIGTIKQASTGTASWQTVLANAADYATLVAMG